MMRTHMPALAAIALAGFCSQANAQAQCPELTRLRGEARRPQSRGSVSRPRSAAKRMFALPWYGGR
jgi:hypothetical protein